MGEWSAKIDLTQIRGLLGAIGSGLTDRRKLHTLYVIQTQGWIFRNWPTEPGLSGLTIATRLKGSSAILQDKGTLRLSMTGASPATQVGSAPGTLNMAANEEGVVGSKIPYAGIHQRGGVIHATKAKNLAIPMTRRARKMGSPRSWGEGKLAFIPSKKPGVTGILVERSRAKPFIVHYVMTPEMNRRGKVIQSKGRPFCIPVSKEAQRAGAPSDMNKDLTFIRAAEDKAPTIGYLVELKERKRTTAHYLLKPSVSIPARPMIPTPEQITPDLVKVTDFYLRSLADGPRGGGSS